MAEKKRLKISFQTFEELSGLLTERKYKIASRTTLGVKPPESDDWIKTFNIGNIMHLQAVDFDEFNDKSQSLSSPGGFSSFVHEETSKDQLLHKTLYIVVAYFCIGTELRFLSL